MAGNYFTVEVKPNIPASKQTSAFSSRNVLFDWVAVQVPRGANKLISVAVILRGTDGAVQTARDIDFIFAKSILGVAPATLGTLNATVSALPIVSNHIIGMATIDNAGDYGGSGFDYFNVAHSGSGAATSHIPAAILEAEIGSGDNVGYDTLYVGGIAQGALDFSTTVLARGAKSAGVLVVETDKGANDDPDADLIFAVGDVLHSATDDVLGTVASIASFIAYDDTDSGTIAATGRQDITLTAVTEDAIADNEEIYNINPIRVIFSFEK